MKWKTLEAPQKGITDYDFAYDILFFKIKDREYDYSIELDDLIIDLDTDGFIIGIQIFEASKFLSTRFKKFTKSNLTNKINWMYSAKVNFEERKIDIILEYTIIIRNKYFIEHPRIIEPLPEEVSEGLLNTEIVCEVTA